MHNVPDGPVEPEGLPDDEVDTLFDGLKNQTNLALAVSGGADSLCLLVLFSEWTRRNGWPGKACVVVVDHGLRPGSTTEAEFVKSIAEQRGLTCSVLTWTGDKPARNIQEAARSARYRLIAEHMRQTGADLLLLGHHLDDQVETFLDRLTRGSGLYGLSAMAADEPNGPDGLHLLRPFLEISKKRLQASLEVRGLSWCEDPSNLDEKYKRSRLRRIAGLLAEEGLSAERLAQTAAHMRRAREGLEATLYRLYALKADEHPAGPVRIRHADYRETAQELRLRLLNLMVFRATGRQKHLRLSKLLTLDAALLSGSAGPWSSSGALFSVKAGFVFCWREAGRQPPELLVNPGWSGIWDERFNYSLCGRAASKKIEETLILGPLGQAPLSRRDIIWPEDWPKEAFECSPVIWSGDEIVLKMPELLGIRDENACESPELSLVRLPFQGKLLANYMRNEDRGAEI